MRVELIDVDGHRFPNLPFMKARKYEEDTGRQWTETENRMAAVCEYAGYVYGWDRNGGIVISGPGDYAGLVFTGQDTCGHMEYESAAEMLEDWAEEIRQANRTAAKNGVAVPFPWEVLHETAERQEENEDTADRC